MGVTQVDQVGKRYGFLQVVSLSKRTDCDGRSRIWVCRCECGTVKEIHINALRQGNTQNCGCRRIQLISANRKEHGYSRTLVYQVWRSMIRRCYEEDHHAYPEYGGRGIKVCDEWVNSVVQFVKDMGPCPPGGTLERSDNSKGYEPGNCRWATRKEQANNRRNNRLVTHAGQTMTISAWGELTGYGENVLRQRFRNGWSVERALTEPVHKKGT